MIIANRRSLIDGPNALERLRFGTILLRFGLLHASLPWMRRRAAFAVRRSS